MITITDKTQFDDVGENKIIHGDINNIEFEQSSITFNGSNNIIVIENGVKMKNCMLKINGENTLFYLSESKHWYYLDITGNNNTSIYFGKNCFLNGRLVAVTSERQNIFIGNDGLFSYGITLRTADPHLVFDCETKQRINHSASVLLGDHVWLGQGAMLLKGTQIGSGSIIGAAAVCAGKKVPSNASYAGNPAKLIKQGVFFTNKCVHQWTEEMTAENEIDNSDKWIYSHDKNTVSLAVLTKQLKDASRQKKSLNTSKTLFRKAKTDFILNLKKLKKVYFQDKAKEYEAKKASYSLFSVL